jgi:two-component system invasion response regulator UvrY
VNTRALRAASSSDDSSNPGVATLVMNPDPSPERNPIRILIADDHQIVRTGIKALLTEHELEWQIGEAASGDEVLQKIKDTSWNVVLLDISMPGMNGVDTLKQIKEANPHLPVLILSMFSEEQYAANLLRAGADGYVCKANGSPQLIDAILAVVGGKRYVSPEFAERLAAIRADDTGQPPHTLLSQREFQVFCKLAGGRAVSEIAGDLELSVKTVSTYRSRILEKMKMKTNADLTYYATKNGLLK